MNPFDEGPPGPNFVGREEELAEVDRALDATEHGSSTGMLVVGLHGTGKSSLLEECIARCSRRKLLPVTCLARNVTAHQQIQTMLEEIVHELDQRAGDRPLLIDQWRGKVPDDRLREPLFQFHGAEFMNTAALKHDLNLIMRRNTDAGHSGMVITLDEAQEMDASVFAEFRQIGRRFKGILFVAAVRVEVAPMGPLRAGEDWLRRTIARPAADPGILRFFPRVVPLGPFADDEAERCIKRRLSSASDEVTFAPELIAGICVLADRIPREVIRLSRHVYSACQDRDLTHAGLPMLEPAYRREYADVIAEASRRINSLGESHQRVLKRFVALSGTVTAEDIARHCHPTIWAGGAEAGDVRRAVHTTTAAMKTILTNFEVVRQTEDGGYRIDSELSRASIKIALQMSAV